MSAAHWQNRVMFVFFNLSVPQRLSHISLAAAYSELTDRIELCNSLPLALLKLSQLMHMHLSRSDISAAQALVCVPVTFCPASSS